MCHVKMFCLDLDNIFPQNLKRKRRSVLYLLDRSHRQLISCLDVSRDPACLFVDGGSANTSCKRCQWLQRTTVKQKSNQGFGHKGQGTSLPGKVLTGDGGGVTNKGEEQPKVSSSLNHGLLEYFARSEKCTLNQRKSHVVHRQCSLLGGGGLTRRRQRKGPHYTSPIGCFFVRQVLKIETGGRFLRRNLRYLAGGEPPRFAEHLLEERRV